MPYIAKYIANVSKLDTEQKPLGSAAETAVES